MFLTLFLSFLLLNLLTFNKIKFDGKTFTVDDLLKEMQDDTNLSNCYIKSLRIPGTTPSCAQIIQSIISKLKDSTPLPDGLTVVVLADLLIPISPATLSFSSLTA